MSSANISDYDHSSLTFYAEHENHEGIFHPEGSNRLIDSEYFVVAEAPDGMRWRRHIGWSAWRSDTAYDEDGCMTPFVYRDHEPGYLETSAKHLADRLTSLDTPKLNRLVWSWAGARYGSQAYREFNMEEDLIAMEAHAV